jgi:hypothetical protein
VRVGRKAGLVVDAVEAVVGQQAELELLGFAARLDQAGRRRACRARRGLTAPMRSRRCASETSLEDRMAGPVVPQAAARDAAHDAVVDGAPCIRGTRIAEVEQQLPGGGVGERMGHDVMASM